MLCVLGLVFLVCFVVWLFFLNSYINTVCFINKCCVVHLAYVIRNYHSTVCMPGSGASEIYFTQQITCIMAVFMYKILCAYKFQNCLTLDEKSKRELKGCQGMLEFPFHFII